MALWSALLALPLLFSGSSDGASVDVLVAFPGNILCAVDVLQWNCIAESTGSKRALPRSSARLATKFLHSPDRPGLLRTLFGTLITPLPNRPRSSGRRAMEGRPRISLAYECDTLQCILLHQIHW